MMQREREERLEGRMVFWGKVEGNENDYLVCYALVTPTLEEGDFPLKKARQKQKSSFPCHPTPINCAIPYCSAPFARLIEHYFITRITVLSETPVFYSSKMRPPPLLKKVYETRAMVVG